MIQEVTIEKEIEIVSGNVDENILNFVAAEKQFTGYLLGEDFHLLTETEKETMLFIHLVIFRSLLAEEKGTEFDPKYFQEIEDKNWEAFNVKGKSWQDKMDVIFDSYYEEELLAFTEDMLNDESISDLAKELIFITAKSYIESKLRL